MIAVRLDRRLAARVDPSDVVQETLIVASRRLTTYARQPEMPFFPWLRQIAMERVVDVHRQHLRTQGRTVLREEPMDAGLPDESAMQLVDRLMASQTSPSGQAMREERRANLRQALCRLSAMDREVLVLIYLEKLSTGEAAAVCGISQEALRSRHRRALLRFGGLIGEAE